LPRKARRLRAHGDGVPAAGALVVHARRSHGHLGRAVHRRARHGLRQRWLPHRPRAPGDARLRIAMSLLVFGTAPYRYLQSAICDNGGFEAGIIEHKSFPDGERYQRIVDDVADRHVAIVGGTIDDTATLELFDLACAAVKEGARTLTLVIPYFGYSTME